MKEKIVGLFTLILLVGITLSFLLQGQGLESIQQFISKKNSVVIENSNNSASNTEPFENENYTALGEFQGSHYFIKSNFANHGNAGDR